MPNTPIIELPGAQIEGLSAQELIASIKATAVDDLKKLSDEQFAALSKDKKKLDEVINNLDDAHFQALSDLISRPLLEAIVSPEWVKSPEEIEKMSADELVTWLNTLSEAKIAKISGKAKDALIKQYEKDAVYEAFEKSLKPEIKAAFEKYVAYSEFTEINKETEEKIEVSDVALYDLGKDSAQNGMDKRVRDLIDKKIKEGFEVKLLDTGVDATTFRHREKLGDYYKKKIGDVSHILNSLNYLDANSQKWANDLMPLLQEFAKISSQKDFVSFKKKAGNKLYSADGVLNFVLAWERAASIYPALRTDLKAGTKEIANMKPGSIKLTLGSKIREQSERYAKATIVLYKKEKGKKRTVKIVDTPPPPPEPPVPISHLFGGEGERGLFSRVEAKPGRLLPTADQFNENITPEVASDLLIDSYRTDGLNSFIDGLNAMALKDPDKANAALDLVFQKLNATDRAMGMKLLGEIMQNKAPQFKAQFLAGLREAIDQETNPEDKKVLELMLLIQGLNEGAVQNEKMLRDKNKKREEYSNVTEEIIKRISAIDESKIVNEEYREFYRVQKLAFELNFRQSMSLDIIETSTNALDASLQEFTEKDVTVVRSLEQLRKLSPKELSDALSNEGTFNFFDSDAEVYLASKHVLEAMRIYLTYLYPQQVQSKTPIQNPVTWALEQVKKGTQIDLSGYQFGAGDYIYDVYTDKATPLKAGLLDPNTLFANKDAELRLFDQYQKGEEQLGEMSIWNLAPTGTLGSSLVAGAALGPMAIAALPAGYALSRTGAGERMHADKAAFGAREGGLMAMSEQFFSGDLSKMMSENGELGSTQKLELAKIVYLRQTRNYDEARALALRLIADKMKEPTNQEIDAKAKEIREDYDKKIRAQVRLSLENNPAFKKKTLAEQNKMIDEALTLALNDKAYLMLMGDQAATLDESKLSEFEKQALRILNLMNGHAGVPITDESMDVAIMISKMVVEIVVIELATGGIGGFVAGAAGAGEAAYVGASGLAIARMSGIAGRAYRAGSAVNKFTRLNRIARVGRAADYVWGSTRGGNAIRAVAHGAAFAEGQALLHGRSLQFIDDPAHAAWEVGMTASTIWALGATQRFMRGQMGGLGAPGIAANGQNVAINTGKSVRFLGTPSRKVGEFLANKPYLRHPAEIGTEILAMHGIGRIEKFASVATGMVSQDQMDAMSDPVAWHEWAQTAGVVLGLRGWGIARTELLPPKKVPKQLPPWKEPRQLPPGKEPKLLYPAKEPKQIAGTAPEQRLIAGTAPEVRQIAGGIPSYDVDVVAKSISENRFSNGKHFGGVPLISKKVRMGGRDILQFYREALTEPNEPLRAERLAELDRLLAERFLLLQGNVVEYKDLSQAEAARESIGRDYPEWGPLQISVGNDGRASLNRTDFSAGEIFRPGITREEIDAILEPTIERRSATANGGAENGLPSVEITEAYKKIILKNAPLVKASAGSLEITRENFQAAMEILGLEMDPSGLNKKLVRDAFINLSRKVHPDIHSGAEATEIFTAANNARDLLYKVIESFRDLSRS